jgi:hypothetical protein
MSFLRGQEKESRHGEEKVLPITLRLSLIIRVTRRVISEKHLVWIIVRISGKASLTT